MNPPFEIDIGNSPKNARDGLKPLDEFYNADERNLYYARIDKNTGEHRTTSLEDLYADITPYKLNASVPDDIATQYDVARNLYVYAWLEYRFFNISEAHALTVLELAMKERIGEEELNAYIKKRNQKNPETGKKENIRKGMKSLMEYCRDYKLIKNEGFRAWHRYATNCARNKAEEEILASAIAEIKRTGKTEIAIPDIEIEKLPPDQNYDHIQCLIDNVNLLRNGYAHGNKNLYIDVLNTFEMVSEFINQLYYSDAKIS